MTKLCEKLVDDKILHVVWFVCNGIVTVGYFNENKTPFFVEEVPREKLEETIERSLGFFKADHQRMTALGFKCLSPYCQYVVRKGRQTVLKAERFNNKNIFPHDGLNNGSTVSGKWIPQFYGRVDMSLSDHVLRVLRSIEIDVWLEVFNVKVKQ